MAKSRGKPFKKGNKEGKGRPPMTDDQKTVSKLSRGTFKEIAFKYLSLNIKELKEISTRPETPMLDMMVIAVMNKALKHGDQKRINWFLEQLFGKLKETKDVNIHGDLGVTWKDVVEQVANEETE